jgi:hypothetical protein
LLRCPWHGWEFDMRNGQSYFDPTRVKVRTYPVVIEDGETLAKGPYVAETFRCTSRTATSLSRPIDQGLLAAASATIEGTSFDPARMILHSIIFENTVSNFRSVDRAVVQFV